MKKLFTICALLLCQLAAIAQGEDTTYTLTLLQEPEDACYLKYQLWSDYYSYWDNAKSYDAEKKPQASPGQQVRVLVTPATGYVFEQLMSADTIMATSYNPNGGWAGPHYYTEFTMPDHDVTITATLHYDPELPDHPGQSGWDEATGSLSITYFTPGQLYDAIRNAVMDNDYYDNINKIRMLIVAGIATNDDMSRLRNLKRYLRHLDLSRTAGITDTWNGTFENDTVLRTILLPASIERIGGYAFQNSPLLESVTCYATTPPEMVMNGGKYPFDGCSPALTVYVPAESLPLYAAADGWKDLNLMPITQGVHSLTVSLPAGADMQQYKDMSLELVNAKTGQTRHYVLTNRTQYTFTNLISGTLYNIYIRNAREDVLGTISGVEIDKQDVQVSFADLKTPRTVTIQLMAPDGTILSSFGGTEGMGVDLPPFGGTEGGFTWTDPVGNFLQKGATLSGQIEGAKVIAKIKLGETLGTQYLQPADTLITVGSNSSLITYRLSLLPQAELSGIVTAQATDLPIRGANISVTQQLNGLYPVTLTTTSDKDGRWTITAYDAPTEVTAQATGYVPETQAIGKIVNSTSVNSQLKDLTGTTVNLDFLYLPAVPAGQPLVPADELPSLGVINYEVYDMTHQQQLSDFIVQADHLVLQGQQLAEGTQLRVTAISASGTFMNIEGETTVDANNTAEVSLPLVQLGQLKATFAQTSNNAVIGILYNANGQLHAKGYYSTPDEGYPLLTFTSIPDGSYTLVNMGESSMFNGINTLDALAEMRLEEGRDYISNAVTVQAGRIDSLHNQTVPMLDESVFYYTTDNTHFTANKTSLTVGNYVTLRAQVEFKQNITPTDLRLMFDLPDGCQLVEGSVMAGNQLAQYDVDGQRVTVPVNSAADIVRFCVLPTKEGYYEPTATVAFTPLGGTGGALQSLGSVSFYAEALSITALERVSSGRVTVSGTAIAGSDVHIYEGDLLIGHTEAGPDGTWLMRCSLNRPYNLSQHYVHAEITTSNGITMQTETKTITVSHGTVTPVVYASNNGTQGIIKWDFRDYSVSPKHNAWPLGPGILSFTFSVDFYNEDNVIVNDTTLISNVVLNVLLSDDSSLRLKAAYNKSARKWVAQHEFSIDNTPKNVYVDFLQDETIKADRQEADYILEDTKQDIAEIQQLLKGLYALPDKEIVLEDQAIHDELNELLAIEDPDEATRLRIDSLITILTSDISEEPSEPADPIETDEQLESLNERKYQWRDGMLDLLSFAVSTDTITNPAESFSGQLDIPFNNGTLHFTSKKVGSVDEQALLAEGYSKMDMTDNTAIYMLRSDTKESYIDTRNQSQLTYEWQEGAATRASSLTTRLHSIMRVPNFKIDSIFDRTEKENLYRIADQLYHIEDNASLHTRAGLAETYVGQGRTLSKQLGTCSNTLYRGGMEIITKQVRNLYTIWFDSIESGYNKARSKHYNAEWDLKYLQNTYPPYYKYKDEMERSDVGQKIVKANGEIGKYKALMNMYEAMADSTNKYYITIMSILRKLPRTLGNNTRDPKVYWNAQKYEDSPIGLLLELYCCYYASMDLHKDLTEWQDTYNTIKGKLHCPGDDEYEARALDIYNETIDAILSNGKEEVWNAYHHAHKVSYAGYLQYNFEFDQYFPKDSIPSLSWYITSWAKHYAGWHPAYFESFKAVPYYYHKEQTQLRKSEGQRKGLDARIRALKCLPKPDEDDDDDDSGTGNSSSSSSGNRGSGWSSNTNVDFYHDPSGYVYEAVSTNRLEGVRATCYYKEEVEDIYGDLHENVVLWNAEEYAQENPLFTDSEGKYRWDVPQGLWQVKYEKAGYETAYSEWLPVPPPQLEVNVGMKQLCQPAVSRVKAYPDGIDITFDKYMRPATLTPSSSPEGGENGSPTILVTKDGQMVSGRIDLLNADSGYETPDSVYASKVRFVPALPMALTDKVQLTIKKTVESYAGLQMEQDFTQQFDVEQRIEAVIVDSLVYLSEGSERTITVSVLPAEAARGKKLAVSSLSPDVVTVGNDILRPSSAQVLTLDQNSQAQLTLSANSLGSGVVRFTLKDDDDLTAATTVIVRDSTSMFVYTPKASRMSGTEIYRGAQIKLTCQTAGATILYTLDGTCPCDAESASVMAYTAPIKATGDELVIKAMAVANGMAESDVVEFRYKVIDNLVGIEAPTVPKGSSVGKTPVLFFRLNGQRILKPEHGLNIVRSRDGSVRKVMIR